MREREVDGVAWAVSWRVNTAIAVMGLLSWLAQLIVEQLAHRSASARTQPGEAWHVWAGLAVLCAIIGGAAWSTWRAARVDYGDVVLVPSMLRLRAERVFCGLGGMCVTVFGVIVLGMLSEREPVLVLFVFMSGLLAIGLWLLFQAPLVVVDRARSELRAFPVGAWLPWVRRVPLRSVQTVFVRTLPTPNGPTFHLVAQLEGKKELLVDAVSDRAEVAERRREELLRLLAPG